MTPAAAIDPEKILRQLRQLWVDLAKEQDRPGGVLRACAMTLIVVAEPNASDADAELARQTIGALMHRHPSRAIVISLREAGDFSASVFSECWTPFAGRQQICAEGIAITADSEQTDEVARLLVPLIAPDLPVVLWCRGPRAFLDRSLDPLFPLAEKVIFDTGRVRNPVSAIEFLRRMCKDRRCVADLAWTRVTGWREAVSHLYDSGSCGDVSGITGVRITYAGDRPGTRALYFARWLERAIPSVNIDLVQTNQAVGASGLQSVVFFSEKKQASVRLVDASTLEIRTTEQTSLTPLPAQTEESLVHEELSILGRDTVYEGMLR